MITHAARIDWLNLSCVNVSVGHKIKMSKHYELKHLNGDVPVFISENEIKEKKRRYKQFYLNQSETLLFTNITSFTNYYIIRFLIRF